MYLGRTALDTALYQQETAFNRRTEVSQLSGKLHTILVILSIIYYTLSINSYGHYIIYMDVWKCTDFQRSPKKFMDCTNSFCVRKCTDQSNEFVPIVKNKKFILLKF